MKRSTFLLICTVLTSLVSVCLTPTALATDPCELAKLTAPEPMGLTMFGWDVAIDGDVAVVGSTFDDSVGAAHVFRWDGLAWSHEAELVPSMAEPGDQAGQAVDVCGDTIVVGTKWWGEDYGLVYVFEYDGSVWQETASLTRPPSYPETTEFGADVALDGDWLVVGANLEEEGEANVGAVHVFRRSGPSWVYEARLIAPDGSHGDNFGYAVAIDDSIIFAGAPNHDASGIDDAGAAYVFAYTASEWTFEQKLTAYDFQVDDQFGGSVAVTRSGAVYRGIIGAPGEDGLGSSAGAAYAYIRLIDPPGFAWFHQTKLLALDGGPSDLFGWCVAVDDETAVVGALTADGGFGAAYVFETDSVTWTQLYKIAGPSGGDYAAFGGAVAIDGDLAVIGAYYDWASFQYAGSAYIYAGVSDADCNGNGIADGCEVGWGEVTDYNRNWVPDDCPSELFAYNLTIEEAYETIADAIAEAVNSDQLVATELAFASEPDIDFNGKALTLRSLGAIDQPADGVITLTDDALLGSTGGMDITLNGDLRLDPGDAANVDAANRFNMNAGSSMVARANANLAIDIASSTTLYGVVRAEPGAVVTFHSDSTVDNQGTIDILSAGHFVTDDLLENYGSTTLIGGSLFTGDDVRNRPGGMMVMYDGLINAGDGFLNYLDATFTAAGGTVNAPGIFSNSGDISLSGCIVFTSFVETSGEMTMSHATLDMIYMEVQGGTFNTSGEIYGYLLNQAMLYCLGNTTVVGTFENDYGATTTVQIGTLYIVGTLVNNGTILGDVVGGAGAGFITEVGDGLAIAGDFIASAGTSLLMPDDVWDFAVGGNFDVAIDDHTRYDMAQATLAMDGLSGAHQTMEMMSLDVGPSPAGLDRALPGHFPIGTLHVSGTTVELVDNHDNDGQSQGAPEAVYAQTLIVDYGAHLITDGHPIYYETLVLDGTVDDPENLIEIGELCPPDVNGDGIVDILDLLGVLAQWGTGNPDADVNGDGIVDILDLLDVLAAWGPCS